MKRLAAVCMLIFCLSLSVFGGHTQTGDRWCNCESVQNICPCCGGFLGATSNQEQDSISQHDSDGAELGIIRLALMTWLKLKA